MIDLRSDTVTRPTAAMRQAMANAEVGDDVFGDDPTIHRLEQTVADLLGKEASLYMPSGTMTNQVALRAHTEPGDEVLLEEGAHVYFSETGAPAALSGISCRLLPGEWGIFSADTVRTYLRPANLQYPTAKLLCVENTHNRGGGTIWSLEQVLSVVAVGREAGLRCHLDGARLWNATIATGTSERDYAAPFDTVSVCFSKGLGAPVGSALAGPRPFIERARRFRKQFGGGMRQAGILAAAALHAIQHHRQRLEEDHANARRLADGIANTRGLVLVGPAPQTNMVVFRTLQGDQSALLGRIQAAGLRIGARSIDTMRAVTHLDISSAQVDAAIGILRSAVAG